MIKPICPRCNINLYRKMTSGNIIYHCKQCFGESLTMGVAKGLIGKDIIEEALVDAKVAASKTKLTCSHCRKEMSQISQHSKDGDFELDVCHRCRIFWFDFGERNHLPKNEHLDFYAARQMAYLEIKKQFDKDHFKNHPDRDTKKVLNNAEIFLTYFGLPVEQNEDNTTNFPFITLLLIFTTFCISFASFRFSSLFDYLAFRPQDPLFEKLINGFTVFFVHGDIFHLVFNLYFFWVFGNNVEDNLGVKNYIKLLMAATFVSTWGFYLVEGIDYGFVGSSGGISGVILYYLLRFPHRRFRFYLFSVNAWTYGVFFFGQDIFYRMFSPHSNTAYSAHILGALVGGYFYLNRKEN